ncbi:hypothetical protein GAR06_02562 [Micromonospora saelicesensis]|uniref:hypothetical protein n=1 Tax=Micromonospora saelicesensis TaxID=285676 RepID=UPI000DC3D76A|nr:hypothetical protein [Micromonospora saelicesensis]RAO47047.1 hypothetical protein GAR06_02562 [Micromonospora saelicesensis]
MSPRYAPLVPADELASPESYRQLQREREATRFRREIEAIVDRACGAEAGGPLLRNTFTSLSGNLASEGALSFAGLVAPERFEPARRAYDSAIDTRGSRGSLHNYLNVADAGSLVEHPEFREAFAHPLLVALVAYALGGPVKIIDLRAKDTQPLDVVARDNTLHVDNSPFMDEFKVIVTWTMGTGRGPSGQGLTYLPRTNRLLRQCFVNDDGTAWSDEDSCIFPSQARVDEALAAQARFFDDGLPRVVHLQDIAVPCHTIFAASRLVHHRYRTSAGGPRSAIMAAFHRTDEGTGFLGASDLPGSALDRFLLATGDGRPFLELLAEEMPRVVAALAAAASRPGFVVDPDRHLLRDDGFRSWYERQSAGVSLDRLRRATLAAAVDDDTPIVQRLVLRMQYDLQGALNMPLYTDLREEVRKRARIVIREMTPEHIRDIVTRHDLGAVLRAESAPPRRPVSELAEELHGALVALRRLLSTAVASRPAGPIWGSTDGSAAALSLRRFIVDLCVATADIADDASLATGCVFGALGSVLADDLFDLGAPGREITGELFGMYIRLAAPSLGERCPAHPEKEKLDTYLESVNEERQTAKLASEVWFQAASAEVTARNDDFVRALLRRVLPPGRPSPESGDLGALLADPAALSAYYWKRVVTGKPVAVRFGAADLDTLDGYFGLTAGRSLPAAVARLREETTPGSPAEHLLRSIERLASLRGQSHAEACRDVMSRLSTHWPDLVQRVRGGPDAPPPPADRILSTLHDAIGAAGEAGRRSHRSSPGVPAPRTGSAEVLLTTAEARELARVYMLARLCFSAEEFRIGQLLAGDPRVRYAVLATHLYLVSEVSRSASELVEDWGTAKILLPFTEAFVNVADYSSSVIDLTPNPKLITVISNNLLPAVAGELLRRDAAVDELDADILAAGVQAAVQRGVFDVTIGLFNQTDRRDVVSLSGLSRRVCPAVRPFGAFCQRWLPYFFDRHPSAPTGRTFMQCFT